MEVGGVLDRIGVSDLLRQDASKEQLLRSLRSVAAQGEEAAAQYGYASEVAAVLAQRSSEPEVAAAALDALGAMGEAGSWHSDDVARYLTAEDRGVRCSAVGALGGFGSFANQHLPKLTACISDKAEEVRAAALVAIARVGGPDVEVAQQAARLASGDGAEPSPLVAAAALQALGLHGAAGEAHAGVVVKQLGDPQLRCAAVTALASLGPSVVEANAAALIASGLIDEDSQTRQLAAEALGAAGAVALEKCADQLLELLSHERPGVRCAASLALGHIGQAAKPHAAAVTALLEDDAEDTCELHLQIGGGRPRTAPMLRRPKCAALQALAEMGATEHARDCAKALGDESYEVRVCALECIATFGEAGRAVSTEIAACLEDSTHVVRAKACECIAALNAEDAMASLPELFSDKSPSVKVAALYALATSPQVAETCSNEVMKCMSDVNPAVKAAAIYVFGTMGNVGCCYASAVAAALGDGDSSVRRAACEALGHMGAYGAAFAEDISACIYSDDLALSQAAQAALDEISMSDGPQFAKKQMLGDDRVDVPKATQPHVLVDETNDQLE